MSFDDEVKAARASARPSAEQLGELARAALEEQREDSALPLLAEAAPRYREARLWQWKGLLERALDEHAEALKSFAEGAALAPSDASIAHGHARVALEAGVPAVDLFVRALRLAPSDAQVYIGLNAARVAAGRADEAEAELDRVLQRSPLWIEGHHQLSQLRSLLGRRDQAFESLERAIARDARQPVLWHVLFDLQILGEEFPLLEEWLARAKSNIPAESLRTYEFIAASELGKTSLADSLSEGASASIPPVWLVRHYLRSGLLEQATALIDAGLRGPSAAELRPYAETVWRLSGDPRSEWLIGDPNLVSVIDLSDGLASIPGLPGVLRSLHEVSGRYLNQSVRGGSQTDGPLFSRIEPEIRSLRALIATAVRDYARRLSSLPDGHPQKLGRPGARVRFSGSWSVRLVDGGFHASHVHPQGWISSALYVSLPEQLGPGEGWLSLGEPPPELGLDVPPLKTVEPKVGRLVLFPSWMWHGTRPFPKGERMTVAFDVAPPVQSSSSS